MGQPVPDERCEDIILQALPAEYERVRTASYERQDFHLADIRRMMSALYIDCLSRRTTHSWSRVVGLPWRRQHHQVSLLQQSGTPPEKLCRLDSGPVQKWKSEGDSFNTVRALEKESRRRWQVDVVLIPQVHHAQRRDMPQATIASGQLPRIRPTRGRTTPPSSLQAILLSGVILRSKAYRSLQ